MLVLHRQQPHREIHCGNRAAVFIPHRFNAVAFSADLDFVRKDAVLVELHEIAAALHALCMNPFMLGATFRRLDIFYPYTFIQQQRGAPQTVICLRQPR